MKTRILMAATLIAIAAPSAFAASHQTREFIREQDLNGNGEVTKSELEVQRRYSFAQIDFDGNGTLNESEYVSEYEGRLYLKLAKTADPVRRREEHTRQMDQAVVRFGVLDTNKDGAMTWDEYLASGLKMFDLHDQDDNGIVNETDVARLAEKEKAQQGSEFISSGK